MPTRRQTYDRWNSMFRHIDDDRIGHGGFEAPNGRRWNEPSLYHNDSPEVSKCKVIGYFVYDFEKMTERFVTTIMLEDYTDTDDMDWQDFLTRNITRPTP